MRKFSVNGQFPHKEISWKSFYVTRSMHLIHHIFMICIACQYLRIKIKRSFERNVVSTFQVFENVKNSDVGIETGSTVT